MNSKGNQEIRVVQENQNPTNTESKDLALESNINLYITLQQFSKKKKQQKNQSKLFFTCGRF